MIFLDIDGTLINFFSMAKKFGIELKVNEFGRWDWGKSPYPTPEEFYAKTELQPWFFNLIHAAKQSRDELVFITKDYVKIKRNVINKKLKFKQCRFYEAQEKSIHCLYPIDLLIDDNAAECKAWREKGGIAYHFDLACDAPFENFLKYWNMSK